MRRSLVGYPEFSRSFRGGFEDDTDAESVHKAAIEAAHLEHERVRKIAEDALELAGLRLDRLRLQETVEQEQERIRLEKEQAALAAKAIELQKQKIDIPKPPPRKVTPSPPPATPKSEPPQATSPVRAVSEPVTQEPVPKSAPTSQELPKPQPPALNSASVLAKPPSQAHAESREAPSSQAVKSKDGLAATRSLEHLLPGIERYKEIHKNLKNLRKFMEEEKKRNPELKSKMGEMRRGIRVAVGQLTDVKGANKGPNAKIKAILQESLTMNSPLVDPSQVMLHTPAPTPNSPAQLPSLFIYLLNIFSKVVIKQFIEEAGVSPKAAEPIGVVAVSIFAQPDFRWRSTSLIDILMAKMRIVCPVVFGIRSSDKTEEGRSRNGWWKENDRWVPDQTHNTRMTGLGAGYASIALRDFSKTKMHNPWPPSYYWRSLAAMVSSPDPSMTQYLVVKAMIDGYEQRFLAFYGSAARAALQAALVEFPKRDRHDTVAAKSLSTLGDKLRKDVGLKLAGGGA